ncbi:hypothetical protein ACN28G_13020 [Micromonospora sp. WMMA1923]|uniref:hypothetical protein n=1 Tax=Micromonospora sp. WMMA1923 TaxID=3404125 RepID=UPI003B95AB64
MDEFFKAIWTAAFVAVVAVIALRDNSKYHDTEEIVTRSRREVGDELLAIGRQAAAEFSADATLVEAIILTENLERPRWFRGLERLKGKFFSSGSYGVMQVWSENPISDGDSIWIAVRQHLSGSSASLSYSDYGFVDHEQLSHALHAYNPNKAFVSLSTDIFQHIHDPGSRRVENIESEADPLMEFAELDKVDREAADLSYEAYVLGMMRQAMQAASKASPESIARLSLAFASFQKDFPESSPQSKEGDEPKIRQVGSSSKS